jgi:hypothetical protein
MSPHLSDYISVLTVRYPSDAAMTKRLFRATNGVIGKVGYGNAVKFDVQKHPVSNLADLATVLLDLADQPNKVVIRGLPTDRQYDVYRRIHGDKAAFVADPAGHHWLFADFDEIRLPLFLEPDDDPELLLGFLVRLLPPEFHAASYYWQWSCGQGIDRKTLRAHLWFWCAERHTDREYEQWAKWINGDAGEKILDHCVFRTVQPNYVANPILADDVVDPVIGRRTGIHIGEIDEVSITIPTQDWDQYVRQLERQEYNELVAYGLRKTQTAKEFQPTSSDRYVEFLDRIGDDKDGFYDPMTRAIWHFARAHPPELDEDFKAVLRCIVRSARCTKQRDLDEYLSDYRLDASLRGAREKQPCGSQLSEIEAHRRAMRRHSYMKDSR